MFSCSRYGLILPGKDKPKPLTFQVSHNVFGNDSDSDDENRKRPALLRPSQNINRQVIIETSKLFMNTRA